MKTRTDAQRPERGFTIIELLVVIAIIGLLASIVIASMNTTQTKARDARRMGDVDTLRKALALYATDGGIFPVETTEVIIAPGTTIGDSLIAAGALNALPQDPTSPTYDYEYISSASGSTYTISFCLETNTIRNFSQGCGNTITP